VVVVVLVHQQVIHVEMVPPALPYLVAGSNVFVLLVIQVCYVNQLHRAQQFRLMSVKSIDV